MSCKVFKYHDGTKDVYEDPLRLDRMLSVLPKEQLDAMDSPDPAVAHPAIERVLAVARQAFGLPPIDRATGLGVDEGTVFAVLEQFVAWTEKKNQTPATPPTSPPPTDTPPPSTC